MQVRYIATGRSANSTKFDELGTVPLGDTEEMNLVELERVADVLARQRKQAGYRRTDIHAFMDDQDMACYSSRLVGSEIYSTRNYVEAQKTSRSAV